MKGEERLRDEFRGCLLGLALGDALGGPLEGLSPAEIQRRYGRVTELVGGGHLRLRPGETTDDTAMMLCLARSIAEGGSFRAEDVARRFIEWLASGAKGVGRTTLVALRELERGTSWAEAGRRAHERLGGMSAGNGSVMRCAPIALLHLHDRARLIEDSITSSLITHFDPRACWGAAALNLAIAELIAGKRDDLIERIQGNIAHQEVKEALIAAPTLSQVNPSAYVVDTLQAAFWCFFRAGSAEEALVLAVNLGGDADTVGAVCGALAGAYYGMAALPQRWLDVLEGREEIIRLADAILGLARAGDRR